MKLFGHPLHIMLIHFPSALFPMEVVCSWIAYYTGTDSLLVASYYAMLGGVLMGWLAVITGMFELGTVLKNKPASMKKALIHGGINTTVLIAYTVLAAIAFNNYPQLAEDSILRLVLKTFFVSLLIAGNFIGGSLVLKDKVLDEN